MYIDVHVVREVHGNIAIFTMYVNYLYNLMRFE